MLVDKIKAILGKNAVLEHPKVEEFGDYSCNLARLKISEAEKGEILEKLNKIEEIEKVEIKNGNFLNIRLRNNFFISVLDEVLKDGLEKITPKVLLDKKILIEYAHPNTHKEMHVGHMRTLTLGESLARILEYSGAKVFRANYQGDIGPHVAKSIWGIEKIIKERDLDWDSVDKMDALTRAHLLGEGYVEGNRFYEDHKAEIDNLNKRLYEQDQSVIDHYRISRRWSLEYYDLFYNRFGTKFDKLYFESEVSNKGKRIVLENVGKVFEVSENAVIFDGGKWGLHKRVFITTEGNPTYEGKEMGLAFEQFADFAFDKNIHVVANEQTGYFQVVIKALELIEPNFVGRQFHLPMGMVNLVGRKISSRTGEIVTVDSLLEEVKSLLPGSESKEEIAMGAVKYAILKVGPEQNVAFDVKQSISVEGNSGPYLQYTYARTCSVLAKSHLSPTPLQNFGEGNKRGEVAVNDLEVSILRWIERFPEVVREAGQRYAPNLICNYLYELGQRFNSFYNKYSILSAQSSMERDFRLAMTAGVGQVLKNGLNLLGIEALERM